VVTGSRVALVVEGTYHPASDSRKRAALDAREAGSRSL